MKDHQRIIKDNTEYNKGQTKDDKRQPSIFIQNTQKKLKN